MSIIAKYPAKDYADFTREDREAGRRYNSGFSHGLQNRTEFLGECPHYDAGFAAASGNRPTIANYVDYQTYCIDRSQVGLQVMPRGLFDAIREPHFTPAA